MYDLAKMQQIIDEASPNLIEVLSTKKIEEIHDFIVQLEKQKNSLTFDKNRNLCEQLEKEVQVCHTYLMMRSIINEMRGGDQTSDNSYSIG